MTQENELTYEEALIAIAGKQPDRGWNEAISFAARMLANAPANIRAALERGPKASRPFDGMRHEVLSDPDALSHFIEQRFKDLQAAIDDAEARVRELEAKLTDAALVEAGWVPRIVAESVAGPNGWGSPAEYVRRVLNSEISHRAASAKADGGGK